MFENFSFPSPARGLVFYISTILALIEKRWSSFRPLLGLIFLLVMKQATCVLKYLFPSPARGLVFIASILNISGGIYHDVSVPFLEVSFLFFWKANIQYICMIKSFRPLFGAYFFIRVLVQRDRR